MVERADVWEAVGSSVCMKDPKSRVCDWYIRYPRLPVK